MIFLLLDKNSLLLAMVLGGGSGDYGCPPVVLDRLSLVLPLVLVESSSLSSCLVLPGCVSLRVGQAFSPRRIKSDVRFVFVQGTSSQSSVLRNPIAKIPSFFHSCYRTQESFILFN